MVKFKYGLPALDAISSEFSGKWERVKFVEHIIFLGIFLGVVLSLILSELIALIGSIPEFDFKFYLNIHIFFLVLITHELIHLLIFPKPWNATIGLYLQRMIFYVTTNDTFSRNRLLLTYIAPTLALTIIPLGMLFYIQHKLIAYIAICNLLGSGIDLIQFFRVVKMPASSRFKFFSDGLYRSIPNSDKTVSQSHIF
jgi:hypothetical protein